MLWWTLRKLRSKSEVQRIEAIKNLGESSDPRAVNALEKVLQDGNTSLRVYAVNALKNIGNTTTVAPLLQALKDIEIRVQKAAVQALCEVGNNSAANPLIIDALEKLLQDRDRDVRLYAVSALKNIGNIATVAPLLQALKDFEFHVRISAAEALGEVGNNSAVNPLISALTDESRAVRASSVKALGKIGDIHAIGPLVKVLKDTTKPPIGGSLLEEASNALRKIISVQRDTKETRDIVQLLIQQLRDKDNDGNVRANFAETLGNLGVRDSVEPLIQALKDVDEGIRAKAAQALGKLGDNRAVDPLIQALGDRDSRIWGQCAIALGRIGNKKAASAVIEYLIPESAHGVYLGPEGNSVYQNLFGDYTSLILEAGRYSSSVKKVGTSDPSTTYTYALNENSVKKLCNINSPISSNILLRLAQIEDKERVIFRENAFGTQYKSLSFEPIRKLAQDELKKRGNPSYDPSAYLDEDAWTT